MNKVEVRPVDAENWRDVARLKVAPEQEAFVAAPTYYLCLCHFGGTWNPLAVVHDDEVVGFLMWGYDPSEDATWLGGFIIDIQQQSRGLGAATVRTAIDHLNAQTGARSFALSYDPANDRARRLYTKLGFVETGELEDGEAIARFTLDG